MDKFSEPEQFDAEVEIHGGEPFAVWALAVNGSHVKAEIYFALLAELEAKDKRIAELERARFIAWPGAMFAPVLARIKVDVKHRDGSLSVGKSAGNVVWYHSDSPSDVVAFALAVEGG